MIESKTEKQSLYKVKICKQNNKRQDLLLWLKQRSDIIVPVGGSKALLLCHFRRVQI